MSIKKKFGIFLLFNLILWSIVPLLRLSLPMDTQEGSYGGYAANGGYLLQFIKRRI